MKETAENFYKLNFIRKVYNHFNNLNILINLDVYSNLVIKVILNFD